MLANPWKTTRWPNNEPTAKKKHIKLTFRCTRLAQYSQLDCLLIEAVAVLGTQLVLASVSSYRVYDCKIGVVLFVLDLNALSVYQLDVLTPWPRDMLTCIKKTFFLYVGYRGKSSLCPSSKLKDLHTKFHPNLLCKYLTELLLNSAKSYIICKVEKK